MTFTIAGIVRTWAAETPSRPALSEGERTVTWSDHDGRSSRVAQALLNEGVDPQDRIGILSRNSIEFFEVMFGVAKVNAVLVGVNWRLAADEIGDVINDSEATVLFVGPDFVIPVKEFEHRLRSVKKIVQTDGLSYGGWLDGHSEIDPMIWSDGEDVALQVYTSGTTGLPKGAMLTNANLDSIVPQFRAELGFDSGSVNLVAMPLFHIGGSGWAIVGMVNGAHTVVVRDADPAVILAEMARWQITHVFLVPAAIMMVLSQPQVRRTDFPALRYMAYGASPITEPVLIEALGTFGCQFVQFYGMTEATGSITLLRADEHDPRGSHAERLRSCGVPFEGVELRVVSSTTGEEAAVGEPGELWTRSAQNMKGYWRNPEASAAVMSPDGWLMTGDAAYVDADGFYYLHDRVKDMIVSGGENVYPIEVENVLMAHPAVADCAVIGVPSDRWGEEVKAVVVAVEGVDVSAAELIDFAQTRIARYKAPRTVDFCAALPRNPSGKVLKRQLREPYWREVGRQVN